MTIEEEIIANPILREVNDLLELQTAKGLAKYKTTVNADDYSEIEWIQHTQEELVDMLVYLTVLKSKLQSMEVKDT
ncbi:MAG: hypothetical protein ABS938_09830 [Psychrobacillus psychrodurans]